MWTLARVAEVIEEITGVTYNQTKTWTILRERLGWTRQGPARCAIERNDEAVATWVREDWPRIKKEGGAGAPGSVSMRVRPMLGDESSMPTKDRVGFDEKDRPAVTTMTRDIAVRTARSSGSSRRRSWRSSIGRRTCSKV